MQRKFDMRRNRVQHFVDGHPVRKGVFLNRRDEEMRMTYIQQQYLIKNKVFSLGQIRNYEKRNVLPSVQYRGRKYFKKNDVSALVNESGTNTTKLI